MFVTNFVGFQKMFVQILISFICSTFVQSGWRSCFKSSYNLNTVNDNNVNR